MTTPSSPSSTASTSRTIAISAPSARRRSWSAPTCSWRGCACPAACSRPPQWLAMERIGRERGNGTLRLTTRQTIQFHGIIKSNLKPAIQAISAAMLDTIAACGDVNRNVIATPCPQSPDLAGGSRRPRAAAERASAAAHPRLARDLARRRAGRGRRGGGRADPRPHLPAAQVQDRARRAAAERCRRVRARSRLHRASRAGGTSWSAAAWG